MNETWAKKDEYIAAMEQSPAGNAVSTILDLLIRTAAGEAEEDAGTAREAEGDAETAGEAEGDAETAGEAEGDAKTAEDPEDAGS